MQQNTRRQTGQEIDKDDTTEREGSRFRYLFPVVTGLGSNTDETVSPLNKRCDDDGLRRHHLHVMGLGTSLRFVFLVQCMCIGLC
jgi:hypothetical protein